MAIARGRHGLERGEVLLKSRLFRKGEGCALLGQFGEQPLAKDEHSLRTPRPINCYGGFRMVGLGPDGKAALIGRLVQRKVLCRIRWPKHFHLVQMQVVVTWQLNPNKAGRLIGKLDSQRLVIAEAKEDVAVVPIDGGPASGVVG